MKKQYFINANIIDPHNSLNEIGGKIIDRHISIWHDIWNELTDKEKKQHNLVGKYPDNRILEKVENNETCYYLPLNFWFNTKPGLSLPIIALQYNKVELVVELNSLDSLYTLDEIINRKY